MTRWAWGVMLCKRCDRSSHVVVEEVENVHVIAGLPCAKCNAPASGRWLLRGGACETQQQAEARAEAVDLGPKRGG